MNLMKLKYVQEVFKKGTNYLYPRASNVILER